MMLQRMQEKSHWGGCELNQKNWFVRTELESKNAERWDFLTVLPSSCGIMTVKPMQCL